MYTPINILMYMFIVFGLWYVVGFAEISYHPRNWLKIRWMKKDLSKRYGGAPWYIDLIQCPACFGFWVGLCVGLYLSRSLGLGLGIGLFTLTSNSVLFGLAGLGQ